MKKAQYGKFAFITSFVLISAMMFTGCRKADITSPEKLVTRPVYNEERAAIYSKIDNTLPSNTSLYLPANSESIGKINKYDINNDGKPELIAFIKNERIGKPNQVGFIVYDYNPKKKEIKEIYKYITVGENIEFSNFYDVTGNGSKDIILMVKDGTNSKISIFGDATDDNDNKLKQIDEMVVQNSDVKIDVGYVDSDSKLDILLISGGDNYSVNLDLVNYKDGKLEVLNSYNIKDAKNVRDVRVVSGNVTKYKKAFIVDVPLQSENSYLTHAFAIEKSKLVSLFNENSKYLKKPYYIKPEDINGDRIIDIPNIDNGIAYQLSDIGDKYASSLISWYDWNSKTGKDFEMNLLSKVYYNYNLNFSLAIPKNVVSKVFIKQRQEDDGIYIDISYIDELDTTRKKLYTITVKPKQNNANSEESKAMKLKDAYLLNESDDYAYGVIIQNKQEADRLNYGFEKLKENFSLIYQ